MKQQLRPSVVLQKVKFYRPAWAFYSGRFPWRSMYSRSSSSGLLRCGPCHGRQRFNYAGAAQVASVVQRFGCDPVGRNGVVGVHAEDRNAKLSVERAQIQLLLATFGSS